MENGGKLITGIKLYKCGYCENNLGHVFKHHPSEKRLFPALVVLIQHRNFGNILYDSGYSELIYRNYFASFVYNAINKSYVKPEDTIVSKLQADSIEPSTVHKLILSHAHPDHIGGLKLLKDYELISTRKVINTLRKGNVFQLVFRNMVPREGVEYSEVQEYIGDTVLKKYFDKVYDVLGDSSVLGIELNGHADGQLGIYLPEYRKLFVADACWGADLLDKAGDMRFIPRRIQNNYKEYVRTIERISQFVEDNSDIEVIYSHNKTEEIRCE